MVFDAKTVSMLVKETWRTLYMVGLSSLISYLIGIPLGVALVVTDKDGIRPVPLFNKVAGVIVNLLRSVPFIILLAMVMPLTRAIVGKTIGANAAVVPLVIAAFPYISRMVEASLKEIDAGVIEAAKSMGASTWQIIFKVLLPESKPSLLVGAAISITTILGYSAMAGCVGAGGLGDVAIRYGYHRYQADMMLVTVVILVIIAQLEHSGTARPVEAGQYDLSGSGGAGHSGGLRRKQQHHHDCLDGHDLYEPADGVHFGAPGALFLPYAAGERRICHQPGDGVDGVCDRLLRRPLRQECG